MIDLKNDTVAPLLLTSQEAANKLRISGRHLWNLSNEGKIPVVKIGRSVRYRLKDLERFAEGLANAS